MENLVADLVKLAVIFIGGGFVALLAYWIAKEVSLIPRLIIESEQKYDGKKILLSNKQKISSESGIYEIFVPEKKDKQNIKIFSSHKGIKILT